MLLQIFLFGYPRVVRDGETVKLERRRTLAFLAYLALNGACSRDNLTALFWPDSNPEQAAAYLRHALWEVGKIIGGDWIDKEGQVVRLRYENGVWCDAFEFEQRTKSSARPDISAFQRAAELQSADFMQGFTLKDSYEFDDWQAARAEGFRLELARVLDILVTSEFQQAKMETAMQLARRRLALDPLDEAAHRQLMRIHDKSGQRSAAIRQYEACQRILHDQLGVAPETETTLLLRQIVDSQKNLPEHSGQPERRARPEPLTRPPAPIFLPIQSNQFIGRQSELEQVHALLTNPECRLLVLTGPGGCGKTRLATQAAGLFATMPTQFPDGIYYCPLNDVTDPQQIPVHLAEAIHLQVERPSDQEHSQEQLPGKLQTFLAEKTVLIVLDNLEQLGDHCEFLEVLLTSAPQLKLLATSRERLNLASEWVMEIAGMPIPDETENVQTNDAVKLFMNVAQRMGRFQPTEQDWQAITRICRIVDGMPLGIELAAAWVRVITCPEISAEIERGLDILDSTTGTKSGPRVAFEHSWRLLPAALQDVLIRLSVFRGGFNRDAALSVAGASLRHLAALADRSLIRRVSSGRYDLHELLKQYAAEKLAAFPELESDNRNSHSTYFLDWICQTGELLKGPQQFSAVAAFHAETLNIQAAWVQGIAAKNYLHLSRAIPMFILFHDMHGKKLEGLALVEKLLTVLNPVDLPANLKPLRALALSARRHLALGNRALASSDADLAESLQLAASLPDGYEKANVLLLNGIGPAALQDQRALDLCLQSRAIFERMGDRWGLALATEIAADTALFSRIDSDLAHRFYTQSMIDFQQMDNAWGVMLATNGLAYFAVQENRLEEAVGLILKSFPVLEALGDTWRIVDLRNTLGQIYLRMDALPQAMEQFRANYEFYLQIGQRLTANTYADQIRSLGAGEVAEWSAPKNHIQF